eukprot:gene13008-27450_t
MAWNTKKPIGGKEESKDFQSGDFCISSPPSDGISCLSVNPAGNMLIAGSWDNSVSCYQLQLGPEGKVTNSIPQIQSRHEAPVLCSDIGSDGMTVFSAGCDRTVRMWNPTQGATAQTIGQHDQPIKALKWNSNLNVVITGSWDKSIRVWDCRQPNAAANFPLNERVHCMDVKGQAMVVGTADRMIHVFDLREAKQIAEFQSPLPYQTRCVSIFHDNAGFAIGSIEGRVGIEYFSEMSKKGQNQVRDPNNKGSNFIFKCHRHKREEGGTGNTNTDVYSVNDIAFHPYNTFCTAGSDGTLAIWDKDARHRLRGLDRFKGVSPVSCAIFNSQGTNLFYALSYDWSKGADYNNPATGNNIYVHFPEKIAVTPKNKK